METTGRHLLVEYHGCNPSVLNDKDTIERLMKDAATAVGATIVQSVFHQFAPQGVSGVVVVEESHLSIHTWPEVGYASVDFYTCGACNPEHADSVLRAGLGATQAEIMVVDRGLHPPRPSMRIAKHEIVGDEDAAPAAVLDPNARLKQI